MSIPVPLGVRIYSYGRISMDRWITPWVSDLSFRSVIPGGFASATIKMTRPRMMQTPEVVTGTATANATGTTTTLPCPDADAADINIGDRIWIYDSGGTIRFGGARFRVTAKPSGGGTTTITFSPAATGAVSSGDVMRAASPGHFQYADPAVFDELTSLFNRVQIVDLRTMEIVWEGRIEDPQRDSDDDSWTLGCLGSMVVASDIQRPMFYVDGDINNWYTQNVGGLVSIRVEDSSSVTFTFNDDQHYPLGVDSIGSWLFWGHGETADCSIARFDITYSGFNANANLRTDTYVANGGLASQQDSIDITALNAATVRKSNVVGTDFTSTDAQFVGFQLNVVTDGTVAAGQQVYGRASDVHIQVMRLDRNGTKLTSATNYTTDYVTVPQIVEDVIGRLLVSGWQRNSSNVPFPGQVRPTDIFIDTSSTAQITHLTYYDGVTAADILNDLVTSVQPNAYWAIWESNYEAADGAGGINDYGFRFEYAKWPSGWGYQITSVDGLDEKPNGEDAYNFLFYKYNADVGLNAKLQRIQAFWDAANSRPLQDMNLVRALTISREPPTDGTTAFNEAASKLADRGKTTNAGSVTVKRPILLYDTGSTSNTGASRMLDPWQIRPGKLARITDMVVPAKAHDFSHGNTAPPVELDGTVFKVVATEYNAAENSCTLELDQVTTWRTETQIADAAAKKSTLVVKG